jgi:adenylate kinase
MLFSLLLINSKGEKDMLRILASLLLGLCMITSCSKDSAKDPQKPLVVILLGAPGSGKGTQAAELAKTFDIAHISTGDLFRENIKNETELGKKAKAFMEKGQLVPDELVFDMLFDRLAKADCKKGYILDGFPRTKAQAKRLQEKLRGKAKICVFNLAVSDDEVIRRLSGRLTCKVCGKIYHKEFNPPKNDNICDVCGGELYQRPDDTKEVILERLAVYHKQTKPVEAFYRKLKLLVDIDAAAGQKEVGKALEAKIKEVQ